MKKLINMEEYRSGVKSNLKVIFRLLSSIENDLIF